MSETTASRAVLAGIAPQFVVPDVVQAAEYYRDVFGFEIIDYFLDPPVFAMVERDGPQIHFGKIDQGDVTPNATKRRVGLDAYVWVSDVDALAEEFSASGAKIIEGPVDRVYGRREIVVEDCFGYRLAFGNF
jgi:predicted enzyme related to lactoylglutathione lyase